MLLHFVVPHRNGYVTVPNGLLEGDDLVKRDWHRKSRDIRPSREGYKRSRDLLQIDTDVRMTFT